MGFCEGSLTAELLTPQCTSLYAEVYEKDSELQELTEVATVGWPE